MPSATSLSAAAGTVALGQPVVLTASVTAGATGRVTFLDGAVPIGTVGLTGGSATFTTRLLAPGSHVLSAFYGGSAAYAVSRSSPVAGR